MVKIGAKMEGEKQRKRTRGRTWHSELELEGDALHEEGPQHGAGGLADGHPVEQEHGAGGERRSAGNQRIKTPAQRVEGGLHSVFGK